MTSHDPIFVDSWEKLVAQLGEPFVFCKTEEAPAFFRDIAGTGRQVILVSGCSDAGLCRQDEHHPNADLFKLACSVSWGDLASRRDRYHGVQVGPARAEGCLCGHAYSLKTERFTWATFDEVPAEVFHWFTTNRNCELGRTSLLPFGLNNDGPGGQMVERFLGRPKKQVLYVNFQHNSLERVRAKRFYSQQDWVTFRSEPNLPIEQYLEEMAEHQFVLAPPGNGLDCYRIWEALYLGCLPILARSTFSMTLMKMGLPVVVIDDICALRPHVLDAIARQFEASKDHLDLAAAQLAWWRDRLLRKRERLANAVVGNPGAGQA